MYKRILRFESELGGRAGGHVPSRSRGVRFLPTVVICPILRLIIERCGGPRDSSGGDELGKPLHGLAAGEMTPAERAPQPEGGPGVHMVAVLGLGGVHTAGDVVAVVPSDGSGQLALGRRRVVLGLNRCQHGPFRTIPPLVHDPPCVGCQGLGQSPLPCIPSESG